MESSSIAMEATLAKSTNWIDSERVVMACVLINGNASTIADE